MTDAAVSDTALLTVWGGSLLIGLVVIGVVAALLYLVTRTARSIEDIAGDIWIAGQRVANNTIHIPLLNQTNRTVTGVLVRASGINDAVAAVEQHAETCPGCPACVLGQPGEERRP